MANLLILSTNFSSVTSTNGQISRTFFEEVTVKGHSVTVLTTDMSPLINYESDIEIKVVHTPSWFKWVVYLCKFISRDLAQWIDIDGLYFRRKAKKIGLELIKIKRIDFIHSICIGYSAHLLAQELHKISGVQWIAQFYDPWVDNFYRKFKTKLFQQLDARNEKFLAQEASHIIHSNTVIRDVWQNRYGADIVRKITIIPFNLGLVPSVCTTIRKEKYPVVFSHIGNFYNQRNSLVFIEAVHNVVTLKPDYRSRIKINYVGRVTDAEIKKISDCGLDDLFHMAGLLPEEECNVYYQESDVFISIDAPTEKPNVFYPSKIIKYFYFEKPILGITPKGGPSDIAFQEAGYASFENNDVKGVTNFIIQSLKDYNSICSFNHNYWKQFTPQYLAKLYESSVLNS